MQAVYFKNGQKSYTEIHIKDAVWIDGGLIRWWRIIRVVDIRILVSGIRGRGLLKVERAPLAVIREVQRRQARPEHIRPVVEAGHPSSQIKMMHCKTNLSVNNHCIRFTSLNLEHHKGSYGCLR